jgi:hypothetical protein
MCKKDLGQQEWRGFGMGRGPFLFIFIKKYIQPQCGEKPPAVFWDF